MSHIQIRIDPATKKQAKAIFGRLGIDMTAGIKMFLKQVIINNGLPFDSATTVNEVATPAMEAPAISAEPPKPQVTLTMDTLQALEYLRRLEDDG